MTTPEDPDRPLTLAERMQQHAIHPDGTVGPNREPPTHGRQHTPRPGPPAAAPLPPAPVPAPPPVLTVAQQIQAIGRRIDDLVERVRGGVDQIAAFHDLTRLTDALRDAEARIGKVRSELVQQVYDDREISLAKLARRFNNHPNANGQTVGAQRMYQLLDRARENAAPPPDEQKSA